MMMESSVHSNRQDLEWRSVPVAVWQLTGKGGKKEKGVVSNCGFCPSGH